MEDFRQLLLSLWAKIWIECIFTLINALPQSSGRFRSPNISVSQSPPCDAELLLSDHVGKQDSVQLCCGWLTTDRRSFSASKLKNKKSDSLKFIQTTQHLFLSFFIDTWHIYSPSQQATCGRPKSEINKQMSNNIKYICRYYGTCIYISVLRRWWLCCHR